MTKNNILHSDDCHLRLCLRLDSEVLYAAIIFESQQKTYFEEAPACSNMKPLLSY